MTSDEIVRKIYDYIGNPYEGVSEYGETPCFFCGADAGKPHDAPDCLWLEIENYAKSHGETGG